MKKTLGKFTNIEEGNSNGTWLQWIKGESIVKLSIESLKLGLEKIENIKSSSLNKSN